MTVTTRRFEFDYKSISAWLMRGGNLIFCEYLNLLHKLLNVIIYPLVLSIRAAYKGFADTIRLLLFRDASQGKQDKEGIFARKLRFFLIFSLASQLPILKFPSNRCWGSTYPNDNTIFPRFWKNYKRNGFNNFGLILEKENKTIEKKVVWLSQIMLLGVYDESF